jgi:hypothetical protein
MTATNSNKEGESTRRVEHLGRFWSSVRILDKAKKCFICCVSDEEESFITFATGCEQRVDAGSAKSNWR